LEEILGESDPMEAFKKKARFLFLNRKKKREDMIGQGKGSGGVIMKWQ
jgi:hypothetical protein